MKGDNPKYTQRGVLIANTNSTGQTIIDYEDVDKNSATSKGTRPLNIIYHEIVEAYEYLTNKAAKAALAAGDKKKAYEIVHQAAIDAEMFTASASGFRRAVLRQQKGQCLIQRAI